MTIKRLYVEALRDLAQFVQFKKRGRVLLLVKLQASAIK